LCGAGGHCDGERAAIDRDARSIGAADRHRRGAAGHQFLPGDLTPVFDAMLAKATRLCEAPFGHLRTWDGECFHLGAVHGEPQFCDWVRQRGLIRPDRYNDATPLGRIIAGERVVSFVDVPGDERYRTSHPGFREMAEASGVRSAIWVALHKDDVLLGTITVYRREIHPFTDKQIEIGRASCRERG